MIVLYTICVFLFSYKIGFVTRYFPDKSELKNIFGINTKYILILKRYLSTRIYYCFITTVKYPLLPEKYYTKYLTINLILL